MTYEKTVTLKDGRSCLLRSCTGADAAEVHRVFDLCHGECDFMLTYPDENTMTDEEESRFLDEAAANPRAIELGAFVDGVLAGTAGIEAVGTKDKVRHRAEYGIGLIREFHGLGIGRALTEACIDCAVAAGYTQLELDVVSTNENAIALYESEGFTEYGRNPRGFRSRYTGWQELILMRRELDKTDR